MASVRQLLGSASELPGDSARREAEILLGHCLGRPRSWLYTWPEKEVPDSVEQTFRSLLAQRREGHPVAYLTGAREFWSLTLAVNDATLIPRPETETLVAWALELWDADQATVLDLGTGSGAIALALASERPHWKITAVDQSDAALAIARENAAHNCIESVQFLQSNWFDALGEESYGLILANPPYIDSGDPHLGRGDLRFEPRAALVAEQGGLADLAAIVAGAAAFLAPGGWLLTEHGFAQGAAVRDMFLDAGFDNVSTRSDLGGLERITGGQCGAD